MKKLFASLFIALGLLIVIKVGIQSVIGLIIGVSTVAVGILLFVLKTKASKSLHPSSNEALIKQLREEGDRIEVILDQCMISDNTTSGNIRISISGFSLNEFPDAPGKLSVVRYRSKYNGKEYIFTSPTMPFDRKQLVYTFTQKETTSIYIDKSNPSLYYFDLRFMFDQPSL
ncbi:MAG: hypothetical protein JST26_16290 [Bacteroidetes bacterium]|nr:hypothetical protein [Bacteroidota bacterium]